MIDGPVLFAYKRRLMLIKFTPVMKKSVLAGSLLVNVVLVALLGWGYARQLHHDQGPSAQELQRPLELIAIDPSWIKSGTPVFKLAQTTYIPSANVTTGLWSCDGPALFEWTFSSDETVHILEGEVEIDYLGKKMTLQVGETAFFHANTKALWHVPKRVLKSYTLHDPGRLVRWYRQIFGD